MSLKTKITIVFVGFTAALLIGILSYLAFSGPSVIRAITQREMETYHQLYTQALFDGIGDVVTELQGLKSEIRTGLKSSPKPLTEQHSAIDFVKDLVVSYPQKYHDVICYHRHSVKQYRVQSIRIFGGETKAKVDVRSGPLNMSFDPTMNPTHEGAVVNGPDPASGGKWIHVFLPDTTEDGIDLVATVLLDHVIRLSRQQVGLNPVIESVITDTAGVVLFSADDTIIHRYLQQHIPETATVFASTEKEILSFAKGGYVWLGRKISMPSVAVFLRKSLKTENARFHAILFRTGLFALIIMLLVLAILRVFLKRMTDSLDKITDVTYRVSRGDFTQKINIERQDELGYLIRSFDQMVDKLDESYRRLNQTNVTLRDKIDELKATRLELSQKQRLALIGETISKISHEIQNKIGGVSIWVQNLEQHAASDETVRMMLDEMKLALNGFMAMLMDFKRFYREPQLNQTEMDVAKLTRNVLHQFQSEVDAQNIQVVTHGLQSSLIIQGDQEQLEKAIANVFINAIYFTQSGGKIEVTLQSDSQSVKLIIDDQGPGIESTIGDRIFQPFFTTKSSGSGLGLAIVKHIVIAHGGEVTFKNLPGGGARFMIRLMKNRA